MKNVVRCVVFLLFLMSCVSCDSLSKSGPTNDAPSEVTLLTPADGATSVGLRPNFTWTASNDPEGDSVWYTVYFGKSPKRDSIFSYFESTNLALTNYQPSFLLDEGTQYFWSVYSSDTYNEIPGDVHTFTTINGVSLVEQDFESDDIPTADWITGDGNAASGEDFWDDQSSSGGARVYAGSWSLYCADNGDVAGQTYDNNMNAYFQYAAGVPISTYSTAVVYFKLWYETEENFDYISFQYWNGLNWVELDRYTGSSAGWTEWSYSFTGGTLYVQWVFVSDGSDVDEGAYLDNIRISGIPSSSPPPPRTIVLPANISAPPKGVTAFIPKKGLPLIRVK